MFIDFFDVINNLKVPEINFKLFEKTGLKMHTETQRSRLQNKSMYFFKIGSEAVPFNVKL